VVAAAAAPAKPPPRPSDGGVPPAHHSYDKSGQVIPGGRHGGMVCHACGVVGHTAAQCTEKGGDRAKRGVPLTNKGFLVEDVGDGDLGDEDVVLPRDNEFEALAVGFGSVHLSDSMRDVQGHENVVSFDNQYTDYVSCYDSSIHWNMLYWLPLRWWFPPPPVRR
jgi:hypothetical protein